MAVGWTVAKAVPLPPSGVVPVMAGRVDVPVVDPELLTEPLLVDPPWGPGVDSV